MTFIKSHEEWLQEYRKNKYNIWITVVCNDSKYYLKDQKDWLKFVSYCNNQKLQIEKVGLQYRSNTLEIDASDCQGVYIIRSILGVIGENSRESITIGKLRDNIVYKTLFVTPELVEQIKTEDKIEDCFIEAIAFNHVAETRTV